MILYTTKPVMKIKTEKIQACGKSSSATVQLKLSSIIFGKNLSDPTQMGMRGFHTVSKFFSKNLHILGEPSRKFRFFPSFECGGG